MQCSNNNCDRQAWGGTKYCFCHLYRWARGQLEKDEQKELYLAISRLLDGIDFRTADRLALLLEGVEGMPSEDVCAILDVSPITLLRMEQRALELLPNSRVLSELKIYCPLLSTVVTSRLAESVVATESELLRFVTRDHRRLHKVSSRDFERIVAEVMRGFGFSVELTAETRDGGYDILALRSDIPDVTTRFIIECKRYSPSRPISVELVRQLYGVKEQVKAHQALLVATTRFTKDSQDYAESVAIGGVRSLHLIDFERFTSWLTMVANENAGEDRSGPREPTSILPK